VLKVIKSAEDERNSLAHGYFGTSVSIPDSILWAAMNSNIKFIVESMFANRKKRSRSMRERFDKYSSELYVYRENDLLSVENQIKDAISILSQFVEYVRLSRNKTKFKEYRRALYEQLCAQAPIAESLRQLRRSQS
jgi:hypothetical protein